MGESIARDPWHANTIRGSVGSFNFTLRHAPLTFPSLSAICLTSWAASKRSSSLLSRTSWHSMGTVRFFLDLMAVIDILSEWKEIKCAPTIRRIVSRVSNRVFVGLPLCDLGPNYTCVTVLTDISQAGIPSGATSM